MNAVITTNYSMKRMMLDIIATATKGRKVNPADVMLVAESMRRHFYRWYIEGLFYAWKQGTRTTFDVLDTIYRSLRGQVNHDAQAVADTLKKLAL